VEFSFLSPPTQQYTLFLDAAKDTAGSSLAQVHPPPRFPRRGFHSPFPQPLGNLLESRSFFHSLTPQQRRFRIFFFFSCEKEEEVEVLFLSLPFRLHAASRWKSFFLLEGLATLTPFPFFFPLADDYWFFFSTTETEQSVLLDGEDVPSSFFSRDCAIHLFL